MTTLEEAEKRIQEMEKRIAALEPPKSRPPTQAPTDHLARVGMPWSAIEALVAAVPDQLVADLVRDNRHGPAQQASVATRTIPSDRGWVSPAPLKPPVGVEHCDRLMDAQDAIDRRELAKRLKP